MIEFIMYKFGNYGWTRKCTLHSVDRWEYLQKICFRLPISIVFECLAYKQKDLKRLRRRDLPEMLLDLTKENAQLRERMEVEMLGAELNRVKYRQRYRIVLKSTIHTRITMAAVAVLVATLWLPVLQIYGSSMTPTLQNGEIVFSSRQRIWSRGI